MSVRTHDEDDTTLLLAAGDRRDGRAAGELYRRHGRRLRLFAARTIVDQDLAEDVVSDVFTDLLARGVRYDPAKSAAIGFLQTLVHRRAIDVVRSREAARRRERRIGVRDLDGHVDHGDRLDVVSSRPALREALRMLSDLQRTAVVERYLRDRPIAEIAREHGVPAATLKTRARDGVIALRRHAAMQALIGTGSAS